MRDLTLITGGAGFIGSNIAAAMAEQGRRIVICDWLEVGDKWRNLTDVNLHDIIRPDALRAWLDVNSERLDAIIHMGAISATTERDGDRLVSENIRLTLDLWTWCAAQSTPFIYASSAATYGDGVAGFDDDWNSAALARLAPLNGYGWSKHVVDRRIARDVEDGRPTPPIWAGLKFFNVYGPREFHKGSMRSVALQIFETISRGGAVQLFRSHNPDYADGGQMRDFVYVGDCAAAVMRLLDKPGAGGIFNLGSGKARSFVDLAHAGFAALGEEPRVEFIDTPAQIRDRYQYFTEARMERLRASGAAPNATGLEDGVAQYFNWLKANAPH